MKMIQRLYIHIPFCRQKCGYCAFYSIPHESELEKLFLKKLLDEFKQKSNLCSALDSIYIGGGTPTILSEKTLETIFAEIQNNFKLKKNCEITIECNPESLTPQKASIIANFANRASIGIQSFNPKLRKILQRNASDNDIKNTIKIIQNWKIKNISFDLIHAIPGQTIEDYTNDLKTAASLGITHLSSYTLTIEKNTKLANLKFPRDEDLEIKFWHTTDEVLSNYGLYRYEVANFAKKNFECKHNLNIWFGSTYLGLGPAASSFDGSKRWTEIANLAKWLKNHPPDYDIIPAKKRASEILAFGLRTTKKWTDKKFLRITGFQLSLWHEVLTRLSELELINYNGNTVSSTPKGLLLWDHIAEEIISA